MSLLNINTTFTQSECLFSKCFYNNILYNWPYTLCSPGLRFRNNIANIAISNSPELENVFKGTTQIDQDNLKRSSSSPQVATPVLLSADRLTSPHSDERFRLSSATSGTSSSSLIHSTSPQANAAAEKAYVIKGLEADPSDSLMSWDMRNLKDEAVRCCDRLLKTVSSAQEHCMRDHLWHLLLKGASSDETMTESSSWKAKGLRKKTEYRRNLSDYTETWPVPSSLKDVADSKGTVKILFRFLLFLNYSYIICIQSELLSMWCYRQNTLLNGLI